MSSLSEVLDRAITISSRLLATGLEFGEGPRFHEGKLYLSDMLGRKIYTIDDSGAKDVLLEVEQQPNGMCFLPDGSLIYTSMFDCKLYRYADGKTRLFADLSSVMTGYPGDMVIDRAGRVYVDDVGSRVLHGEPRKPGRLVLVQPDGSVQVVADDIAFPNGIAINSSANSLLISASTERILYAFDIAESGELSNRRRILDLTSFSDSKDRTACDGLCIDAEDGLWLSLLDFEVFARLDRNGTFTHVVHTKGHATACALGGPDGKTLYLISNEIPAGSTMFKAMMDRKVSCTVSVAKVDIPRGAGLP